MMLEYQQIQVSLLTHNNINSQRYAFIRLHFVSLYHICHVESRMIYEVSFINDVLPVKEIT